MMQSYGKITGAGQADSVKERKISANVCNNFVILFTGAPKSSAFLLPLQAISKKAGRQSNV